jgi:hypothetical protein
MIKYYCDICGSETQGFSSQEIKISRTGLVNFDCGEIAETLLFCDNCWQKIDSAHRLSTVSNSCEPVWKIIDLIKEALTNGRN